MLGMHYAREGAGKTFGNVPQFLAVDNAILWGRSMNMALLTTCKIMFTCTTGLRKIGAIGLLGHLCIRPTSLQGLQCKLEGDLLDSHFQSSTHLIIHNLKRCEDTMC